ncbi:MAG: hypothetical protein AAF644_13665, partial [Pseudomonadota bacterium]
DNNPDWFGDDYAVDVEGKLQPFSMKNVKSKIQLRTYLIDKANEQQGLDWISRFKQVFDTLESALSLGYERVYGQEFETNESTAEAAAN